eukprot:TRINITY_DN16614_c0_g1_i2.p1 TRINITY_DN16614_c0_g1~~TRINITY_DN16614_c0_g1_i2.p1  ORF type:complete len:1205 (-),score=239.43 TRINITY_DN16614_c0_g1_i2:90-3704(-)
MPSRRGSAAGEAESSMPPRDKASRSRTGVNVASASAVLAACLSRGPVTWSLMQLQAENRAACRHLPLAVQAQQVQFASDSTSASSSANSLANTLLCNSAAATSRAGEIQAATAGNAGPSTSSGVAGAAGVAVATFALTARRRQQREFRASRCVSASSRGGSSSDQRKRPTSLSGDTSDINARTTGPPLSAPSACQATAASAAAVLDAPTQRNDADVAEGRQSLERQAGLTQVDEDVLSRRRSCAARCQDRLPSPHVVCDSWYDKTGAGRAGGPVDGNSADELAWPEDALHVCNAQQRSFKDFLQRGLARQLRQVKANIRLHPESVVLVSPDEADGSNEVLDVDSDLSKWAKAATLRSLLPSRRGGNASSAYEGWEGSSANTDRFRIELLEEGMWFKPLEQSAEGVLRDGGTSFVEVCVPARISDGVNSALVYEANVSIGRVPLMDDYGSFVIGGNRYTMVHRFERTHAPYYSVSDKGQHKLLLYTKKFTRLRVLGEEEGGVKRIFISSPAPKKGNKVPVHVFLAALGLGLNDIKQCRHADLILPEGEQWLPREEACRETNRLTGHRMTLFEDNQIACFDFRFRWLRSSVLGSLGRRRYNSLLGLNIPSDEHMLTTADILAAVDLMGDVLAGERTLQVDDIDSVVNRKMRSVGDMFEDLVYEWLCAVQRSSKCFPIRADMSSILGATASRTPGKVDAWVEPKVDNLETYLTRLIWRENNRQMNDDTNALSELMQARRVTQVGNQGLEAVMRIKGMRLIHPSHYGRICPVETGEGKAAGIVMTMAAYTKVSSEGELLAPHQRVVDGRRQLQEKWQYLLAEEQIRMRVAQFDTAHRADGRLCAPIKATSVHKGVGREIFDTADPDSVPVTHLGRFIPCRPERVDMIACAAPVSTAVGLIPFLEHDDANRALMGAKMQQQAVPTLWPERPIMGTGMEAYIATGSSWNAYSVMDGQILTADSSSVTLSQWGGVQRAAKDHAESGEATQELSLPVGWEETGFMVPCRTKTMPLFDIVPSKKHTMRHHSLCVNPGDRTVVGEPVAQGSCFSGGELCIGKNLVCAYMAWEGCNFEDAIVISKRVVREDIFTSVHICELDLNLHADEELSRYMPGFEDELLAHLDGNCLAKVGTWLEPGDVAIGCKRLTEVALPEDFLVETVDNQPQFRLLVTNVASRPATSEDLVDRYSEFGAEACSFFRMDGARCWQPCGR